MQLLVVLGISAVLAGLIVGAVVRGRGAAQTVTCTSNLRQIFTAFSRYAVDHGGRLPDPWEQDTTWEQLLLRGRYVTDDQVFRCHADDELYPSIGSSYDWRDTPRPDTTLAGHLISSVNRYDAVFAFDALPGWHTPGRMNAVLLDGSAHSMDQDACLADLRRPLRPHAGNSDAAATTVGRGR